MNQNDDIGPTVWDVNKDWMIAILVCGVIVGLAMFALRAGRNDRDRRYLPLNSTMTLNGEPAWVSAYDWSNDQYTVVLTSRQPTVTVPVAGHIVRDSYASRNPEKP